MDSDNWKEAHGARGEDLLVGPVRFASKKNYRGNFEKAQRANILFRTWRGGGGLEGVRVHVGMKKSQWGIRGVWGDHFLFMQGALGNANPKSRPGFQRQGGQRLLSPRPRGEDRSGSLGGALEKTRKEGPSNAVRVRGAVDRLHQPKDENAKDLSEQYRAGTGLSEITVRPTSSRLRAQ